MSNQKKKNNTKSEPEPDSSQLAESQDSSDSVDAGSAEEERKRKSPDDQYPIVGIGASAGGIEALEILFSEMPADAGVGFIVVQHLHPDHESRVSEILQHKVDMPVTEAQDGEQVALNHVYVIPPGKSITLKQRTIKLIDRETPSGKRTPIDILFRSMAEELQQRAICIILSGTGSDGTAGMREIKGAGGMAMVQDEKSAGHAGMPKSAIDTGLADYVIPPEQMPNDLIEYCRTREKLGWDTLEINPEGVNERKMDKLFSLIKDRNGHDFSRYKKKTVLRRVQRRMSINKSRGFDDYLDLVSEDKLELDSLFDDLLIGVTTFFRDKKAWEILEQEVVIKLVSNYSGESNDTIRVWINGCATGEEAYTVAILFKEAEKKQGGAVDIQIFATDINEKFIEFARQGVYTEGAVADVPDQYLNDYFEKNNDSYKISKEIRKMLNFAQQDVTSDPPFSRLDLISCRNLLIYMERELQEKVFNTFHYALKEGGYLFIGSAESLGRDDSRFLHVDEKTRLFKKHGSSKISRDSRPFSPSSRYVRSRQETVNDTENNEGRILYQQLIEEKLLANYFPAAILIDSNHQILHIHGRTGKYLEPAVGEARLDILKMAREGLELDLKTAIYQSASNEAPVRKNRLRIKTNGDTELVNLVVIPVKKKGLPEGLKLVIIEDAEELEPDKKFSLESTPDSKHIRALQDELKSTKEDLQTTIEELETSNEELTSTNEELQSTNEELLSSNQELETSKEELQSINEELTTVNSELEDKVSELEATQNDLHNLLASTQIGTIFLDTELKILRYTPHATDFIPIIESDVGRSLEELSRVKAYEEIITDCHTVLNDLTTIERELKTEEGEWFSVRIRPYRTTKNAIVGVVIAFINITESKAVQEKLIMNQERFQLALKHSPITIFNQDLKLRYTWIHNPRVDYLSGKVVGKADNDIFPEPVARQMKTIKQGVLQSGIGTKQSIRFKADGEEINFSLTVEPLRNSGDKIIGITCALVQEMDSNN